MLHSSLISNHLSTVEVNTQLTQVKLHTRDAPVRMTRNQTTTPHIHVESIGKSSMSSVYTENEFPPARRCSRVCLRRVHLGAILWRISQCPTINEPTYQHIVIALEYRVRPLRPPPVHKGHRGEGTDHARSCCLVLVLTLVSLKIV